MQKRSDDRADWQASRSWLSTARWAMRSAPLAGRFFSAKRSGSHRAVETTVESFDESSEGTLHKDDQSAPAAFMDPPAAPRTEARKAGGCFETPDRSSREARCSVCARTRYRSADLLQGKMLSMPGLSDCVSGAVNAFSG